MNIWCTVNINWPPKTSNSHHEDAFRPESRVDRKGGDAGVAQCGSTGNFLLFLNLHFTTIATHAATCISSFTATP